MKIAVVGLGAMGLEMATWLADKFDVVGYDISTDRMDLAAERGVSKTVSAREACSDADVVLVAVRSREQLDDMLYGEAGVAPVMKTGSAILLTSTIGIVAVQEIAAQLKEQGIGLIDAPVSGGPVRAGKVTCWSPLAPTRRSTTSPSPCWTPWPPPSYGLARSRARVRA